MPTPTELRDALHAAVIRDLRGPADGPAEILPPSERNVRGRYLVGLLAPKGHSALPEAYDEEQTEEGGEEDGTQEARPAKAAISMLPSSLGLSFEVSDEAPAFQITVRWGHYQRVTIEQDAYRAADGHHYPVWQRVPVETTSPPIALQPGVMEPWIPNPQQPEVYVEGRIRERAEGWSVTLFLVNAQQEPAKNKDESWLFQVELEVTAPDGGPIFRRRTLPQEGLEAEERLMAMLYRHEIEFAVGHGVAVTATRSSARPTRAEKLATTSVPYHDVPQSSAPSADEIPELAGLTLDMKVLSELPDGGFATHLQPLTTAYASWIAQLTERIAAPTPDLVPHLESAQLAVTNCRATLLRIQEGITLLDQNGQAADAFRFANRAMYLQRIRSEYAARVRQDEKPSMAEIDVAHQRTWRTFQLAFLLLNMPALTDLAHPDRAPDPADPGQATADLLWFPTGGGKTEAYLGVAAYTMAIRRLQGDIGGRDGRAGVAVLMRYTLRLLTLQQFQRAATLLAACEIIRRDDPARWGEEPFRLGLWVGRRTTPNWTKDAEEVVKQLRQSRRAGGQGTPHQLTNCPWCGRAIQPGDNIVVRAAEHGPGRTYTYCGDPLGRCPFSQKQSPEEGIPVIVVDEEIYRRLPTLLIATVDKFAQLPWNGRTAMLFGQVDGYCTRHGYRSPEIEDSDSHPASARKGLPAARTLPTKLLRPPDLIIQDELHLISGPLGTLVGLYETAVERLASWEVGGKIVRPKVIASTATVRRAQDQVHSLFLRQVNIFPPPGLEARDNFFARERDPSEEHPGRRYLGICAPGIRHKSALIRAYIAFLAAAQSLYNLYGDDLDPWMTLVGYFNALRELGSMRRAVDDSITNRLRTMDRRGLARRYLRPWNVEELTSRKDSTDIPEILDRLERPFEARGEEEKAAPRSKQRAPIDVLLATNMLSVGVDVSRLGLMVVASQPKTTAEYIQATSRVGRRYPGLVATVYNWARPRDLSHYERFAHYHATFYEHVEALSVTPFSAGALQRGLSALLVTLVRLLGTEFNANSGAERITREHPYVQAALTQITARAGAIQGSRAEALVRQELLARLDHWLSRIDHTARPAHLGYQGKKDGLTMPLLQDPTPASGDPFTCPSSLRNVEASVNLLLNDYGMDRDEGTPWLFAERAATTDDSDD